MKTIDELKTLLYEKYGSLSLKAYKIIEYSIKNNVEDIHELTKYFGQSFKFVREVLNFRPSNSLKFIDEPYNLNDNSNIIKILTAIHSEYNYNNKNFDHILATEKTIFNRAELIFNNHDCKRCNILFLGDHDLTSIAFALYCKQYFNTYNIYVVDIDETVLKFIDNISKKYNLNINTSFSDFRFSIPKSLKYSMDIIFTDPPYTPEGINTFLLRAIELCKSNYPMIYLAYKTAETSPGLGILVQKQILKLNLYIYELIPNFNKYYSAEAIGYSSDIYKLFLTPKANGYLNKKSDEYNIYTHGANSIESNKVPVSIAKSLYELVFNKFDKSYLISPSVLLSDGRINFLSINNLINLKSDGKLNLYNKNVFFWMGDEHINYEQYYKSVFFLFDSEFYIVFNKKEKKKFFNNELYDIINKLYYFEEFECVDNLIVIKFKYLMYFESESNKIFAEMLKCVRSGIKNAFVNVTTNLLNLTKNNSRLIFDDLNSSTNILHSLICYEVPINKLLMFYKRMEAFDFEIFKKGGENNE